MSPVRCSHAKSVSTIPAYVYGTILSDGSNLNIRIMPGSPSPTLIVWKQYLSDQLANGTPVTVWYVLATPETAIVNEPLCKIGDYADELHSEDAGVTIPTIKGTNTLAVGTTLSPSSTEVTYLGIKNTYKEGWEIRDQQDRLIWGKNNTLTGVSPISFRGYGIPLKSVKIVGNTQQTGTPAPDAPIMPTFCGDRTANIYNTQETVWIENTLDDDGNPTGSTTSHYTGNFTAVKPNTTYYISRIAESTTSGHRIYYYDSGKNWIGRSNALAYNDYSFTTVSGCKFIQIQIGSTIVNTDNWMISEGLFQVSFEPYGYKLPITNAGQTTPIYLGQTQSTRRIKKLVLTGQEIWSASNGACYITKNNFPTSLPMDDNRDLICSHFANGNLSGQMYNGNAYKLITVGRTDVDEWKSYLAVQYAAGTPVTVWYVLAEPETAIVNEPLCKIGSYADELIIDPNITPQTGTNTLTVDTTLSPSLLSITGHIKQE